MVKICTRRLIDLRPLRNPQRLLAESRRLQTAGRDAVDIDQGLNDGVGAPLAEGEVMRAGAGDIGIADHDETEITQDAG